jgi:hypothetical protein
VDLAIAKVNLAALRARRGTQPDEDALASMRLLHDFASRELRAAEGEALISEDLVPDRERREALQRGLASMSRGEPACDAASAQLLGQLVSLLSALTKTGNCTAEQGKELHGMLRSLEPKPAPRPSNYRLARLTESLNAFS